MSRVLDAIAWDGVTPVVSLFLITAAQDAPDLASAWENDSVKLIKNYRLEDDRNTSNLPVVLEIDFELEAIPVGIKQDLESCLQLACDAPGSVAWLAFEGSFHFDHILTDTVADQIYGICATGDSPLVVLDDGPAGQAALRERMHAYRSRLRLG